MTSADDAAAGPLSPAQQQIAAMATLLGVLIGALRANGIVPPQAASALFSAADAMLPASALPFGPELLAAARLASDRMAA